jgi:tetratricopeptide (TPR) repeat protein
MEGNMQQATGFSLVLVTASVLFAGAAFADDNQTCYKASGDTAIAACTRVIDSSRSTKDNLIDAYTNRGQEYYIKKNYAQAVADFDMAIRLKPQTILAYGNRGNAKSMLKQPDAAIADYTKAIANDREYTAAYTGRAMEYENKGQKDLAIADYRAALRVKQKYQDGKWAHDKARERLKALGVQ